MRDFFFMQTLQDPFVTFNNSLGASLARQGRLVEFSAYTVLRWTGKKRIPIEEAVPLLQTKLTETRSRIERAVKWLLDNGFLWQTEYYYYHASQKKLMADRGVENRLGGEYRGEQDAVAFIGMKLIGLVDSRIRRSFRKSGNVDGLNRPFQRGEVSYAMICHLLGLNNRMSAHRLVERASNLGYVHKERQFEMVTAHEVAHIENEHPHLRSHIVKRMGKFFRRLPNKYDFGNLEIRKRCTLLQ